MSEETYSQDIEKTKKAFIDAFTRLKDVHEDIEKFNAEDNFDKLEISTAKREALFERLEYLKARLSVEAADWLKQRKQDLPGELIELKEDLNEYLAGVDEQLRAEIPGILLSLFELGAEQIRGNVIRFPDGYGKFIRKAAREATNTNTSQAAKLRKELSAKTQELNSPDQMSRICNRIESSARTEAAKSGFDHQRHFLTPCYRGRK